MKKTLYYAKVGVKLDLTNPYYDIYFIKSKGCSLFGKKVAVFTTLEAAKSFATKYVVNGIKTSYGIVWSQIDDITDEDLLEIEQTGFYDGMSDYIDQHILFDIEDELMSKLYKLYHRKETK